MKEYYDRKVIQKVTPKQLSKLLHEEFSRDQWGDINPEAFANPTTSDSDNDMAGLYEVLERVCERINNNDGILNKNHLTCPKCDSTDTSETVTIEKCHNCGFQKDYHNWDHNEPDFK